ncbi:serine/threonine-protein kinase [Saccharopolyspora sp. NFXS83]|uniref:serine/threonine-protein kinase n=1 Tax=Saccharopolyspora sp. NFXS83 TaxID=2993560 RepID=UPI00224B6060|nr:serine/threonine-protein kinase [Saccharopolyspora sp. NFXS83]MCX2732927.1 serine/threonine-protein kinase [Saccharopolyspora sp. NFXS83]
MPERMDAGMRFAGGRYEVTGELGRGGMGIVWRARDARIDRDVAIKQLHVPEGLPAAERRVLDERLRQEVRIAGRLSDPGVVTVHDVFTENGATFIVMELVDPVTLSDVVGPQRPMPPARVAELALRMLSALEAAHAAGIVHRDVKPGNIMISGNGVKLADFGIAQTVDDPRLTTTGALIGSPAFMAPERIRGHDATPASDLWSLGATLFFALEGWLPFDRQTTAATLHAVLNETPRMSRDHGAIGALVAGLLTTDPRARLTPDQARALLSDLPARAEPARGAMSGRSGSRRWWLIGAVPAAVVLFVAGLLLGRLLPVAGAPGGSPAPDGGNPLVAGPQQPTRTYGPGGDVEPFDMGEDNPCADTALEPGDRVTQQRFRPCDSAHDVEIYTSGDVFGGRSTSDVSYPGRRELTRFAEGMCGAHFATDKIDHPDKERALRYGAVIPTAQAWEAKRRTSLDGDSSNDEGSQIVHCYVRSADGTPLTTPVAAD